MNDPIEAEVKIAKRVAMRLAGVNTRHCAEILKVMGRGPSITLILETTNEFELAHGEADTVLFKDHMHAYVKDVDRKRRKWQIQALSSVDADLSESALPGDYCVFFRRTKGNRKTSAIC